MNIKNNLMEKDSIKNIIFITLDGFRKDKVSFCPTLENYVNNSIEFTNMTTVAPYTSCTSCYIFWNVSFSKWC